MSLGVSLSNLAYGQFDHYEPYVAVDIGSYLDDPLEPFYVEAGEAMDVNDMGLVVGWYQDGDDTLPFVFNPTDGGSMMTVNLGSYEEAVMMAINMPNGATPGVVDPTNVVIVGWANDTDQPSYDFEPARWLWDSQNNEWDLDIIFDNPQWEGVAYDVNAYGVATGYYRDASPINQLFVMTQTGNTYAWGPGIGYGINDSGMVVGDDLEGNNKAFVQTSASQNDRVVLTGASYSVSRARSINNDGHIVGGASDSAGALIPWIWYYDEEDWDDDEEIDLGSVSYDSAIARDLNSELEAVGEFYVNTSSIYRGFYSIETGSGWDSESLDGNAKFPTYALTNLLGAAPDAVIDTTYGTCERGWVVGSFLPDRDESEFRPCVIIPNDVDNNGSSDLLEIKLGIRDDENGNYLIDWAENDSTNNDQFMRVGLHSPGVKGGMSRDIQNVQIVRFPTKYENVEDVQQVGPTLENEFYGILDVVNGVESQEQTCLCEDYLNQLELWARRGENHTPGQALQNEIIITLRNQSSANKKRDVIPGENRDDLLEALRKYSYRFAHAIDYMQFGNESFSGVGMFLFYKLGTLVPFSDLEGQALVDGTDQVHVWILEQLEVARSASALAGRPLRFIGPGNPSSTVEAGYMGTPIYDPEEPSFLSEYEDKCAYVIGMTNTLLNEERMYFDLHMHYLTADSAIGGSQEYPLGIIDMVVDTNGTGWTSNVPEATVCLEWGPRADTAHAWWNGEDPYTNIAKGEFAKYLLEGDDGNPIKIPYRNWRLFLTDTTVGYEGWQRAQFGPDGFLMGNILSSLNRGARFWFCE